MNRNVQTRLEEDVWKCLKVEAMNQQKTLHDLIKEILSKHVAENPQQLEVKEN